MGLKPALPLPGLCHALHHKILCFPDGEQPQDLLGVVLTFATQDDSKRRAPRQVMRGSGLGVGAHPGHQEVRDDRGDPSSGEPPLLNVHWTTELSLPQDDLSVSFSIANRL